MNADNISRLVTADAEHAKAAATRAQTASGCAAIVLLINPTGRLSLSSAGVPAPQLLAIMAGVVAELAQAQAQQPKTPPSPILIPGVM